MLFGNFFKLFAGRPGLTMRWELLPLKCCSSWSGRSVDVVRGGTVNVTVNCYNGPYFLHSKE